jgi:hypothetical protein
MTKKPAFVSILSYIFLVFIMLSDFLGALYITDGNIAVSVVISAIIVICYFFVINLLVSNKEALLKNKLKHYSIIFWIFYASLGAGSFFLMNHFFNVEINCKDNVKKEALNRIQLLHSIADEYDLRLNADLNKLESGTNYKLSAYQVRPTKELRSELLGAPYYISETTLSDPRNINAFAITQVSVDGVKQKFDAFTQMLTKNIANKDSIYRPVFDNWRRMSLLSSIKEVDEYLKTTKDSVNIKLAELPFSKSPLSLKIPSEKIPLNNPQKIKELYPNNNGLMTIILITVIHLFLLIPFFMQEVRAYSSKTSSRKSTKNSSSGKTSGSIEI